MIAGLPGRDVQARDLIPLDRVVIDQKTVTVVELRVVAMCWSLPATIVVDWDGEGTSTGCTVYPDPEAMVFVLDGPPPRAQVAAA